MRKPFNKDWPLTQKWGENPDIYKRFGLKGHNGTDWGMPSGSEVVAPHNGKVLEVANDPNGYGKYIKIENDEEGSVLAHLKEFKVKVGDDVFQGEEVALSDNTGFSTAPHLHWGYYRKPRDREDGYLGYISPFPFILNESQETQKILDETIKGRDHNWNLYLAEVEKNKQSINRIVELEGQVNERNVKVKQLEQDMVTCKTQLVDATSVANKAHEEDLKTAELLLETEHKLTKIESEMAQVATSLSLSPESPLNRILEVIASMKKPNDEFIKHYEKVVGGFFKNLRNTKWSFKKWIEVGINLLKK